MVRDFSERNDDGMAGDKLDHDPHRFIIVYRVEREQLSCFSENGSVDDDEAYPLEDLFFVLGFEDL